MIRGYFHEGRPFSDGLLRVFSDQLGGVRFLVDTGADNTTLHPVDYRAMGLRFASLDDFPEASPLGVGGRARYKRVPSHLFLRHDVGHFDRVRIDVLIARPDAWTRRLPSLLGRDVLDLYVLVVNRRHQRLTLDYA